MAALYCLGSAKGERLIKRAAAALSLASLMDSLADGLEISGLSMAESLSKQLRDERYRDLWFLQDALKACCIGEPLDKALKDALAKNPEQLSKEASDTAMRAFDGIGRADARKEAEALRAASQKLLSVGDMETQAAVTLKGYYRSVYAIAGATLAVFLM